MVVHRRVTKIKYEVGSRMVSDMREDENENERK